MGKDLKQKILVQNGIISDTEGKPKPKTPGHLLGSYYALFLIQTWKSLNTKWTPFFHHIFSSMLTVLFTPSYTLAGSLIASVIAPSSSGLLRTFDCNSEARGPAEACMHSCNLSYRKHVPIVIICVVHKIHKHRTIRTSIVTRLFATRKHRFTSMGAHLIWGVGNIIGFNAGILVLFLVSPYVETIEIVTNLMNCCSSSIPPVLNWACAGCCRSYIPY